jgi:hypothetical protein
MICRSCVKILIKEMEGRSGNPIDGMLRSCDNPDSCEAERLRQAINKYTLPNPEAKNEYAFLKKLSKLSEKP